MQFQIPLYLLSIVVSNSHKETCFRVDFSWEIVVNATFVTISATTLRDRSQKTSCDAESWATSETWGNDRNNFPSFCSLNLSFHEQEYKYFTASVKNDRGYELRRKPLKIRFTLFLISISIHRVDIVRVKCLIINE